MFDFFTKTEKSTARNGAGSRINLNFSQSGDKSLSGRPGVNVYFPKSFSDVEDIIESLSMGNQVVVNLKDVKEATAQRVIDILCGAIFALKGGLCEIENNIFVITPYDISVK